MYINIKYKAKDKEVKRHSACSELREEGKADLKQKAGTRH